MPTTGDAVLLLFGVFVTAASGIPGLLFPRRSVAGQWLTTTLAVFGSGAGLIGAILALAANGNPVLRLPSPVPQADFVLAADALSAFFLVPVFLISLLGSI